jgi:hypothetical protein
MTFEEFKSHALAEMDRSAVDAEFLPYVDRVNALPHAVTRQCCSKHMRYDVPKRLRPRNATKRWGYLQLVLPIAVADWTHGRGRTGVWNDWLWIHQSQLFVLGAREPQVIDGLDDCGIIAFAWDAARWPRPAEDVVSALEAFASECTLPRTPGSLATASLTLSDSTGHDASGRPA